MHITTQPPVRAYSPVTPSKLDAPKQDDPEPPHDSFNLSGKIKTGLVFGAAGGLGYLGSIAHGIPVVGPVVSGIAGAIVGASAGASAATVLPHQPIKAGAVLGAVGGAIFGATTGGSTFGNVAMTAAGASMPFGLLVAIFSGAS